MSSERDDFATDEVLVVGAGPAGLMAAATLARYGVPVTLVERRVDGPDLPRATVSSTRTMELLRGLGLAERVRQGADEVAMTMLETRTARESGAGTTVAVGFPSAEQSAVVSPERPACVAQDHLEQVLRAHLAQQPGVRMRFGWEVTAVTARTDDALVRLRGPADGQERSLAAAWVVAADGAWSAVRHGLGIEMIGPEAVMVATQTEVRAPLWDVVGEHRHLLYAITHPEGAGTLIPAGRGNRWIFAHQHDPDAEPLTADRAVRRLRTASGVSDLPIQLLRHRRLTVGAQIATAFSRGRVCLTGDAAHRVTPRGGTGLNTAVASGCDLAWKLACVIRGWALPALLDTYEADRRVVAEHQLARSLDPLGTRRPAEAALPVDLGGRMPHLWLDTPARVSTLDRLGLGPTYFAAPARPEPPRRASPSTAVSQVDLTAIEARSLGIAPGEALLVGPDGVPIGPQREHLWPALDTAQPAAHRRAS